MSKLDDYETVIKIIAYSELAKPGTLHDDSSDDYMIGVVDGHRYCAKLCRDVLAQHGIDWSVK